MAPKEVSPETAAEDMQCGIIVLVSMCVCHVQLINYLLICLLACLRDERRKENRK